MSQRAMEVKEKDKRFSINAFNLLVTCLFLFFAVQFSDGGGGFARKINRITENLNEAVLGLDQNITYSDYNDTSEYISSTSFHAKGMAGLYNLTNMFIDAIVPEDILIKGIFYIDTANNIQVNQPNVGETISYYRKLFAVALALALCIVLFPLCGLCFCCCRCCGNCGARSQPADKKKDTCKKIMLGSLLIILGTGLLFCVVCAFGSNQQLQDGVDSFPNNVRNALTDTKTFLDATNNQMYHLLQVNYDEFRTAFLATMDNSTEIVTDQLADYKNATAMTELVTFTNNLDTIKLSLNYLKENSNRLRVYASQLNDALRKVKRDLLRALNICPLDACIEISADISKLATNIDFNSLPDMNTDIESFGTLDIDKLKQAAHDGQAQLDSIPSTIDKHLQTQLQLARDKFADTATTIKSHLKKVSDAVDEVKNGIDDNASPVIDKADDYIRDYGKYRYYVGIGISCVLLLVTICIALGLVCGICGKRPDGYSDNCCNKGAGSQFLVCAVMIMFIFGFVISIIATISLVVGVISEKGVCDPVRNPNPEQYGIIELLDSYDLGLDFDIKPSTVLNNCYKNQSAYVTFNLKSRIDLDEIKSEFNISEQLEKIDITDSIPTDFHILTPENENILTGLKNYTPSANLKKFTDELENKNFTNYSLMTLSNQLEAIIVQVKDQEKFEDLTASLRLSVLHLHTYNEKLLVPMQELANNVVLDAETVSESLRMNRTNFSEAVDDLIQEIRVAELTLSTNGTEQLKVVAEKFKIIVKNQVESYVDRVSIHLQSKIGLCGPLSLVINATVTSACNKVLLPWNGFWFSLFWTIVLYVIVIIVSVKLANLYQKYKPYGQYVETEYLYDAYADRGDSIPLNSRAKRGKKKGKKSKRYEERPIGSEVARDYAAGSRPPDGRYADMAPKHWEEFPNGGPPHYQRAPTEYERPPPYYYPGSGGGDQ